MPMSLSLLDLTLGLPIVGFLICVGVLYVLNKLYRIQGNTLARCAIIVCVALVSAGIFTLLNVFFLKTFGIASLLNLLIPCAVSYFLYRKFFHTGFGKFIAVWATYAFLTLVVGAFTGVAAVLFVGGFFSTVPDGPQTLYTARCNDGSSIALKVAVYKQPLDFELGDAFGYGLFYEVADKPEIALYDDSYSSAVEQQRGIEPAPYSSWDASTVSLWFKFPVHPILTRPRPMTSAK